MEIWQEDIIDSKHKILISMYDKKKLRNLLAGFNRPFINSYLLPLPSFLHEWGIYLISSRFPTMQALKSLILYLLNYVLQI